MTPLTSREGYRISWARSSGQRKVFLRGLIHRETDLLVDFNRGQNSSQIHLLTPRLGKKYCPKRYRAMKKIFLGLSQYPSPIPRSHLTAPYTHIPESPVKS